MTCFIIFDTLIVIIITWCIFYSSLQIDYNLPYPKVKTIGLQRQPYLQVYKILAFFLKNKKLYDQLHHLWYTNHQRHNVMHLSIVFTLIQFFEPPRQQLPMANTFYKLKMFFGTFSFQFQIKRTLWPASSPLID
jgi:hypothetical protein